MSENTNVIPFDPSQLGGLGQDTVDDSSSIALLKIIQARSAEVDPEHPKFPQKQIAGASAGDILFTAESRVIPQPVEFVPVSFQTCYAEWKPVSSGGGLVQHHEVSVVSHPQYRKITDENGRERERFGQNDLVFTIYVAGFFIEEDKTTPSLIAFTSSNLKHGRLLSRFVRSFRYDEDVLQKFSLQKDFIPPVFARTYKISTTKERKDNNTWYEFSVVPGRVLDFQEDETLVKLCFEAASSNVSLLPSPEPAKRAPSAAALTNGEEDVF